LPSATLAQSQRLKRAGIATSNDALRPSHPVSRLVTIGRNVPLVEAGCGQECTVSDFRKQKYFWRQDWTVDSALNPLANFDFWRSRFGVVWRPRTTRLRPNRATDLPDK
jgi:hypothetical protein